MQAADNDSLAALWKRLVWTLEAHIAAEEKIFYPALLKLSGSKPEKGEVREQVNDAIKDHNEIRDALAEVAKHRVGTKPWFEAVAAVNEANGDHIAEEEREALTDFRKRGELTQRHELAIAFATFEAHHITGFQGEDKDPKKYITENK